MRIKLSTVKCICSFWCVVFVADLLAVSRDGVILKQTNIIKLLFKSGT